MMAIVKTETEVVVVRLLALKAHSRPQVSSQLLYILIFLIIVTNFKLQVTGKNRQRGSKDQRAAAIADYLT
jgi:hypothetical protein